MVLGNRYRRSIEVLDMKIQYGDAVSDVLTTILNALQFKGEVFCYTRFTAPWAIRLKRKDYAHFHFFEHGQAWVVVEETGAEISVETGDLVIFPRGGAHLMRDSQKAKVVSVEELLPCRDVLTARWRGHRNHDCLWRFYFREPISKSNPAAAA